MMNKKGLLLVLLVSILTLEVGAQTGLTEDFNDNLNTGWTGNSPIYLLNETNQEMKVDVLIGAGQYSVYSFDFSTLDLSSSPYLKIKIKASGNFNLRIDLIDATGKLTNTSPAINTITGNNTYKEYTYSFVGKFSQSWPSAGTVDPTQITGIMCFVNPGGAAYTGTFYMDDVLIGSATGILPPPDEVKMNQIGFYPQADKLGIVATTVASTYYVVSEDKQDTVYTGTLAAPVSFSLTGESLAKANFSDFKTPGKYYLLVPAIGYSNPFEIKDNIHHDVSKAGLKFFYFQRASMHITAPYAGAWARTGGHFDTNVLVHNSAASAFRPENTSISSPRGWYDAGDYNKYIVTGAFSTYFLLAMYEHYPTYFDTLNLQIPESTNNLPDVLDEALYEIRWMLTMQDPSDGGVYHKLTNAGFGGTSMPSASNTTRYVVQKSTSATLDFAAVMAQSARVVKLFESELPGLADSCILAAKLAWKWARANPSVPYIQSNLSNPDINTGEYGDNNFTDERQWAAMELYATTLVDSFYTAAGTLSAINPPSWADVRALGYLSLSHLRKGLTSAADTNNIKSRFLNQANYLKTQFNSNPYGSTMNNSWNFSWGSNGGAAIHGVLLLHAFDLTKDSTFLDAAIGNMDYLMGKNGTNYAFVTGYGTLSPKSIHHRICSADGVADPIPGFLAGGPNTDDPSDCGGSSSYPSALKGKAYLDAYCSYSTNEVAINWNAAFAYLGNVIEAIESGGVSEKLNYQVVNSNKEKATRTSIAFNLYPNPAKDQVQIELPGNAKEGHVIIVDVQGAEKLALQANENTGGVLNVNTSSLTKGMYFVQVKTSEGSGVQKLVVE